MRHWMSIFGIVTMLAGCGSTDKDRAVSGGGIGAGLGAAAGLLIGGPLGGFVLGGAVGTATGLVTDQDTIDLGKPIWDKEQKETMNVPRRQTNDRGVATTRASAVATILQPDRLNWRSATFFTPMG